jgi:hypothetical protein
MVHPVVKSSVFVEIAGEFRQAKAVLALSTRSELAPRRWPQAQELLRKYLA